MALPWLLAAVAGYSGVVGIALATVGLLAFGIVERFHRRCSPLPHGSSMTLGKVVHGIPAAELELLAALTQPSMMRRTSSSLFSRDGSMEGRASEPYLTTAELAERALMASVADYHGSQSRAGSRASSVADSGGTCSEASPQHGLPLGGPQHGLPLGGHLVSPARNSCSMHFKRIRFKATVSCCYVREMCSIDPDLKAELWWQQVDFGEFLRVRVAIGQAYRAAAKRRGVHIGSEFPKEPEFRNESRRGLGLGRKNVREKHRKGYIQAVLDEQTRQREAAMDRGCDFGIIEPDVEKIAARAKAMSQQDNKFAQEQALRDYKITMREHREDYDGTRDWRLQRGGSEDEAAELPKRLHAERKRTGRLPPKCMTWGGAEEDTKGGWTAVVRGQSFCLPDDRDEEMRAGFGLVRAISPGSVGSVGSKGFGLSRDDLARAGLSVTGHLAARAKPELRRRLSSEDSGNESDGASGMSDASGFDSDGLDMDGMSGGEDSPSDRGQRKRSLDEEEGVMSRVDSGDAESSQQLALLRPHSASF